MPNPYKMKTTRIFILLVFFLAADSSFAQKSNFFITTKLTMDGGDTLPLQGAVKWFVVQFDNKLKESYPCAEVTSESDIAAMLEHERELQLLGSSKEGAFQSIAGAMACDYMIIFRVSVTQTVFSVSADLIPYRNQVLTPIIKAEANGSYSTSSGDQMLKACETVAKKLVDGLKHIEVCAFKGEVKVQIKSTTNTKKTEEYAVFCNHKDGSYRQVTTVDKSTENNWDLRKTGKNTTSGNIGITIREELSIVEQNDCYKCPGGREGGRTSSEKKTTTADVNGLSHESQSKGIPIDDARVTITFNEDDTYTIKVEATSTQGQMTEKTEMNAEGTCDNVNTPPKTIIKKADVPLNETFGPFPGTSADKVLVQSKTISKKDPATEEKTTTTIEFNLKRD